MDRSPTSPSKSQFDSEGYVLAPELLSTRDATRLLAAIPTDSYRHSHALKHDLDLAFASTLEVASRSHAILHGWWPHKTWMLAYAQIYVKAEQSLASQLPWHQDRHFWKRERPLTVPIWTALDDMTPDNGCLQVVPKSHVLSELRSHAPPLSDSTIPSCMVEEWEPTDTLEMQAGTSVLYHERLVHQSLENPTARPRRALALGWNSSGA